MGTADAFRLLYNFLAAELDEDNVQSNRTCTAIRVRKPAGQKSVTGTFLIRESDTHATSGQTLISMRREKVGDTSATLLISPGIHPPLARVLVVHRARPAPRALRPQGRFVESFGDVVRIRVPAECMLSAYAVARCRSCVEVAGVACGGSLYLIPNTVEGSDVPYIAL